jgi:predicted naringenin-chalcone synthase
VQSGGVPVSIRAIETVVPATVLAQPDVRDLFARQPGITRLGARMIGSVFDAAAIDTRHTVLAELAEDGAPGAGFLDPATGELRALPTGRRNEVFREAAAELFVAAAKQALANAPGLVPADVSHVVTVSCTGFYAPGPDIEIVRALGLAPSTQRYHVGFMGCYGAFPALRAAADFCRADPEAVVLVVAVELCTLHLHSANDADTILSSSLFADGGAAAVVTARPAPAGTPVLDLDRFTSTLVVEGEGDMAWTIGDEGFEMVLSGRVPRLVERHVRSALEPLLGPGGDGYPEIAHWAVHPGGRSILDRVQAALGLTEDQLAPSRAVLRRYGNMSSATVLFVLRTLLQRATPTPERVGALAFGPGVSVETALLTLRVAADRAHA